MRFMGVLEERGAGFGRPRVGGDYFAAVRRLTALLSFGEPFSGARRYGKSLGEEARR